MAQGIEQGGGGRQRSRRAALEPQTEQARRQRREQQAGGEPEPAARDAAQRDPGAGRGGDAERQLEPDAAAARGMAARGPPRRERARRLTCGD